jgi:histidinol-phosphate aminotransferase
LHQYSGLRFDLIIPNPNAPTGIALETGAIRELLADNPESVVIIDEAYVDYGAESACQLIPEFPNLLVVQTFSKSRSLAGLRLGYALGHEDLIEALQRVKNSFNSYPINRLTSAIALAAIADEDYFQKCRKQVIASRELFVRHPEHAAETLYLELKTGGILVRYFNKARIDNCLRISIGTDDECDALIAALKEIVC